jgi:hypothetical protein
MRTRITQEQVTAIIQDYCNEQGVEVNFIHHGNGEYSGCLVDHDYEIELPDSLGFNGENSC